jgi:hypothetical protein
MAPKGSHKAERKATARVISSEHICGLIQIYTVCGLQDERAWDLFYDTIFLDPITTRHISQFQLMWPHRRSRSSPFQEWWAVFHSYIGQMIDKTHGQMNYWRWDNSHAFGDQVDYSNPHTISLGKGKCTSERFSWYGCNDPRAMNEPPSCQQYKPGDFLAVRPLNWHEIMDEDDDDLNCGDPRVPSGGWSRAGDDNDNYDGEGEEEICRVVRKGPGKGRE